MTLTMRCSSKKWKGTIHAVDTASTLHAKHWNLVLNNSNPYLSLGYLIALEEALKEQIQFKYLLFYSEEKKPIAIAYTQLIRLTGQEQLYPTLVCHVANRIGKKFLETANVNMLVCGNIFTCGENGIAFTDEYHSREMLEIVADEIEQLQTENANKEQISFFLFKEFWQHSIAFADRLMKKRYRGFRIDVNMVMPIHPSWKNKQDYLHHLTTKFRTKALSVYKKSDKLQVLELSHLEILQHNERIEELYLAVIAHAEYKFKLLNAQAFVNFKKELGEKFIFKAYFLNSQMVGFSTSFALNNALDAGHIGIDYTLNKELAIYQRMLYDLVEQAIFLQVKELYLGRTSELIKSSLGAVPVNMKLYIKHRNSITNKLISPLIASIEPATFELRSPFKKEVEKEWMR
jgi:hypothetical protein